ncbi:hypothetical protein DFH09DRAFT_1076288 [Mycena vulgaris]|nr:hypothetical protein DFH09DRAFT_1076288 [Mycena vulgaris]
MVLVEAEEGLPAVVVTKWNAEMTLWEEDAANPNPFTECHETVMAIRGRLAMVAAGAKEGDKKDDVLPEDTLYKCSNQLLRKIAGWIDLQKSFTPLVTCLRTANKEYIFKDENDCSVAANTRANTTIKRIDDQIRHMATQYQVAQLAILALAVKLKETEWKKQLHILTPDDVCACPHRMFSNPLHKQRTKWRKTVTLGVAVQEAQQKKEEERPTSWIWLLQLSTTEGMDQDMMEALCLEWTEEVDLVGEEMQCVLDFLRWKVDWWFLMVDQHLEVGENNVLYEGFTAYACHPSQIQQTLRERFEENWRDIPCYMAKVRTNVAGEGEEEEEIVEGLVSIAGSAYEAVPEVEVDTLALVSFVEDSLA